MRTPDSAFAPISPQGQSRMSDAILDTPSTTSVHDRHRSSFSSISPSTGRSPSEARGYDFSKSTVPKARMIGYLTNWITECAPLLDKFDTAQHFAVQVPLIAQDSPPLLYAIAAFSARQLERKTGLTHHADSLELYQTAISLLAPILYTKDRNVPVIACILACLELMSGSAQDWRRHVEGCATLFGVHNVTGFCGGVEQAAFWCFARMDLCGTVMSEGLQNTVYPLRCWAPTTFRDLNPPDRDQCLENLFSDQSRESSDMHANWAVYLCAKVCELAYQNTNAREGGNSPVDDQDPQSLEQRWTSLWGSLQRWWDQRSPDMLPFRETSAISEGSGFPGIFFPHWPAISSNQLYHTACIIMLDLQPDEPGFYSRRDTKSQWSTQWHARRVCGISVTNEHPGSLVNAIQPLYIAGKTLSHSSEHLQVGSIFVKIESLTGWGALWRLADLESVWGYEHGEILQRLSAEESSIRSG